MSDTPVFTTTEPQPFGARGPLNEMQKHHIGYRKITDPTGKVRNIYIHGKAERMMGYDIPVILSGEVMLTSGITIPVKLLHPADEQFIDAVLWQKDETTWYITYPEEVE